MRARLPELWGEQLTDPPVEGSCGVYADDDILRFERYDADANSDAGGWDQMFRVYLSAGSERLEVKTQD